MDSQPIHLRDLKNLGPKSEQMLLAAGITTVAQLCALGPVAAYLQVKGANGASLNLLYALYGALNDCHWTAIPAEDKQQMLLTIDAAADVARLIDSA